MAFFEGPEWMTPAQQEDLKKQQLIALGAGLLRGSAPRVGAGGGLGEALGMGLQQMGVARQSGIQGAMQGTQFQEMMKGKKRRDEISKQISELPTNLPLGDYLSKTAQIQMQAGDIGSGIQTLSAAKSLQPKGTPSEKLFTNEAGERRFVNIRDESSLRQAQEAGFKPYVKESPLVSVTTGKEEGEEAKAVGKYFGTQYVQTQEADKAATNKLSKLDRLDNLLSSVETGKLKPLTTNLAGYAKSLGIEIDPNLPYAEAAQALASEMALELRNPAGGAGMPGAMSDKDREFLERMVPRLANTPGGNKLIIESSRRIAKRDKVVAAKAREYRKKHGKIDEGFSEELSIWAEKNPVFEGMSQFEQPEAAPQMVSGPQVGTVESGYRFKGGDPSDPNNWEKQ